MHRFPCENDDCLQCMMADLDSHVAANGGKVYTTEKTSTEKTRNLPAGQKVGNGYVRTISPKQVNLILKLIDERNTSTLTLLPGQTLDPKQIPDMGVKGGSALIEKLFACPFNSDRKEIPVTEQGSDKQKTFLRSLMQQTNLAESDINSNYKTISEAIGALIDKAKQMPKAETKGISEGAYWYEGKIARVQKSRSSGKLYAKLQIEDSNQFEYVPGLINKLNADDMLSIEDMKAFAQEYSQCADCGTKMTNRISIARGVGPICSGKGYTL